MRALEANRVEPRAARRDTVLVVDDTPEALGLLTDMLDGAGYTVLIATDGESALHLVDQIEADVSQGLTRKEAIVEATVRRARPVVLTALAAILAMIPLSRSAFWGPMAITIMGGLFVATFLTLLYLPGLYALWFRKSLEESGQSEQPDLAPQHLSKDQAKAPHAIPLADAAE